MIAIYFCLNLFCLGALFGIALSDSIEWRDQAKWKLILITVSGLAFGFIISLGALLYEYLLSKRQKKFKGTQEFDINVYGN